MVQFACIVNNYSVNNEAVMQHYLKPSLMLCFSLFFFVSTLGAQPNAVNPFLMNSPWAQGHRTNGMTASSPYAGPVDAGATVVQLQDFRRDAGVNLGTSPWLILSEKKYTDRPDARTVWGSSLQYVYKYVVDGEDFAYVDRFKLDGVRSISWNILGVGDEDGGRFIVPQPQGLSVDEHKGTPCYGETPALLVFGDGDKTTSPLECRQKFELNEALLRERCEVPAGGRMGYSASAVAVLHTGEIVTKAEFHYGRLRNRKINSYMVVLDNELRSVKQCALIDDFRITNNAPGEPLGRDRSALYYPTDDGIVKMVYDARRNTIKRAWKKQISFRGRTGTTPTKVVVGKDRFIVVIDGECAVGGSGNPVDVITGKIRCSETDPTPSRLIAISLDDPDAEPHILSLPANIRTIENSPSSSGDMVVVANYGGYKPTKETRGVVAARWNAVHKSWEIAWHNPDIQMNGVTTISEATGLVYSSGMEDDGNVYMYGLKLRGNESHAGGEVVFRKKIGRAQAAWDAGNNTIINDDGSMLYCTSKGIARLYQDSL